MVEEARLESSYTSQAYQGFESPSLRKTSKTKKGSKYDKSRKIKVLRDFLFLLSDIRKTRKSPVRTEYRY